MKASDLQWLAVRLIRLSERVEGLGVGVDTVRDAERLRQEMLAIMREYQNLFVELVERNGIETLEVFSAIRNLETGPESQRVGANEPVRAQQTQRRIQAGSGHSSGAGRN